MKTKFLSPLHRDSTLGLLSLLCLHLVSHGVSVLAHSVGAESTDFNFTSGHGAFGVNDDSYTTGVVHLLEDSLGFDISTRQPHSEARVRMKPS